MDKIYNVLQLDKKLSSFSKSLPQAPKDGWIKTIRSTLGMTYEQLSKRLGISIQRLVTIESSEVNEKLKLETLSRVAEKLGCELHYVVVPIKGSSLMSQLEKQALKKSRRILTSSGKHMSLEDQLEDSELEEQARLMAQTLLQKSLRDVWDE